MLYILNIDLSRLKQNNLRNNSFVTKYFLELNLCAKV